MPKGMDNPPRKIAKNPGELGTHIQMDGVTAEGGGGFDPSAHALPPLGELDGKTMSKIFGYETKPDTGPVAGTRKAEDAETEPETINVAEEKAHLTALTRDYRQQLKELGVEQVPELNVLNKKITAAKNLLYDLEKPEKGTNLSETLEAYDAAVAEINGTYSPALQAKIDTIRNAASPKPSETAPPEVTPEKKTRRGKRGGASEPKALDVQPEAMMGAEDQGLVSPETGSQVQASLAGMMAKIDALKTGPEREPQPVVSPEQQESQNLGQAEPAPPETRADYQATMAKAIAELDTISKNKPPSSDLELAAEEAHRREVYFAAMSKYQRARSGGDAIKERLGITKARAAEGDTTLRLLKQGWLESRAAQARMQLESAGPSANADEARLNRMNIAREVAFGAVAAEQKERQAALDSRSRTTLEGLYKNFKKHPKLMIGLSAVALSGGGFAAITGGTIAMLPLIALGLGGARLRWLAEEAKAKGKTEKAQRLQKGAQFFSMGGIASWFIGNRMNKLQKKETDRAAKTLSVEGGMTGDENLGDAETLAALSASLKGAHATLAQKKARTTTTAAVGGLVAGSAGGALFGAGVHGLTPGHAAGGGHGVDVHHGGGAGGGGGHGGTPPGTGPHAPAAPHPGAASEHAPATPAPHPAAEAVPAAPTQPAIPHESLAVGGKIHDADQLLGHFRDQLHTKYPEGSANVPDSVKALFNIKGGQDALTHELGLQHADGTSIVVHPGDTVELNSQGQIVLHFADGHAPHVLIDRDSGGFSNPDTDDLTGRFAPVHHAVATPAHTESAPVGADTPPADPDSAAMADYLTRHDPHNASVYADQPPQSSIHIPTEAPPVPVASKLPSDFAPIQAPDVHVWNQQGVDVNNPDYVRGTEGHPIHAEASTEFVPNIHGADLTHVGLLHDSNGHLFAHAPRTGTPLENSEAGYNAAVKFAQANPGKPIYFVEESRNILGIVEAKTQAVIYDPAAGMHVPQPYVTDTPGHLATMPPVPKDSDLYPPATR